MFVKPLVLCVAMVMMTNMTSTGWSEETNYISKGFGLSIATDKAVYHPTEPITITLVIFNHTEDTLTFTFTSSKRYDFFIRREEKEIWRWSADKLFAQMMGKERIESGECLIYKETYKAKEKPISGTYTITGVLTCRDPLRTLEGTVCIQVRGEELNINKVL